MDHNIKDVYILQGIMELCDDIFTLVERFGNSKEALESDLAFQYSCAFSLEQIGELAKDLSPRFAANHPEIPWRSIIRMRNELSHNYGSSCVPVIWQTISEDIAPLRDFCAKQIGKE